MVDFTPPPAFYIPTKQIERFAPDLVLPKFDPGFFVPVPFAGRVKPLTTLTLVGSTSGTSTTTMALPSGTKKGDVATLCWCTGANTTITISSDWRKFSHQSTYSQAVAVKILDAADIAAGSVSYSIPSGDVILMTFRPDGPVASFTAGKILGQYTTGTPAAQTQNLANASTPSIVIATYLSSASLTTDALSPETGSVLSGTHRARYKIWNEGDTVSTVTSTMPDRGSNHHLSLGLQFIGVAEKEFYETLELQFEDADGATSTSDTSKRGSDSVVNFSGASQIDTAQKLNGSASLLIPGSGTNYATVSGTDDPNNPRDGGFTWEFWFRASTTLGANLALASITGNATYGPFLFFTAASNQLLAYSSTNNSSWGVFNSTNLGTYGNGKWHHACVERHDGVLYVYIDGVMVTSSSAAAQLYRAGANMAFGSYGPNGANPVNQDVWFDDVRYHKFPKYRVGDGSFVPEEPKFIVGQRWTYRNTNNGWVAGGQGSIAASTTGSTLSSTGTTGGVTAFRLNSGSVAHDGSTYDRLIIDYERTADPTEPATTWDGHVYWATVADSSFATPQVFASAMPNPALNERIRLELDMRNTFYSAFWLGQTITGLQFNLERSNVVGVAAGGQIKFHSVTLGRR